MAALCRSYASQGEALQAVDAVLGAGTDRELVTSYPDDVERMRVLGHGRITRLLTDAGLDEATAKRDVDALHRGLVLVLVDVAEDDTDRVAALLKG